MREKLQKNKKLKINSIEIEIEIYSQQIIALLHYIRAAATKSFACRGL